TESRNATMRAVVVRSVWPVPRLTDARSSIERVDKKTTDLRHRIALIDEHVALDDLGNGRGFVTFMLDWKHTKDFGGLAPTGREGTSIETALLTIRSRKITRIDVAANSVDLVIYEWERGWALPHNVVPGAIVVGVDRRR